MSIIGIDLGTTNSLVASVDAAGRISVLHNSEGANLTPSVIWFDTEGKVIVGSEARKMIGIEKFVFSEFKRAIGTNVSYPIPSGKTASPTDLSALVLRKIRADVEASSTDIRTTVVTVPANFRNEQREATLAAARSAGLNVQFIINEPTAAALYYAHHAGRPLNGNYVVYDLGGGTFDVSIISAHGNEVEVLASEGVSKLGGKDFDEKLTALIAKKYQLKTGTSFDAVQLNFAKTDAEDVKKSLSVRDSTTVRLVSRDAGPIAIDVSRHEFEDVVSSLIAQAEMLCEGALSQSGLTTKDIQQVFLAGGSSRMPMVKQSVQRLFKQEPVMHVNPDEVIALGAALYAAHMTDVKFLTALQATSVHELKVQDIAPAYFGTISLSTAKALQGQSALVNNVLIKKGARIPCAETQSFYTVADNQTAISCTVTQSPTEETDPKFVRTIWSGSLAVPGGRPKDQEVQVTYAYNENGVMKATFRDVASRQSTEIDLSIQSAGATTNLNVDDFLVE